MSKPCVEKSNILGRYFLTNAECVGCIAREGESRISIRVVQIEIRAQSGIRGCKARKRRHQSLAGGSIERLDGLLSAEARQQEIS